MIHCEATTAAQMAMMKEGISHPGGAQLKNGSTYASGRSAMKAACPIYVRSRLGYTNPIQLTWIA
jgi:hypothetical protein